MEVRRIDAALLPAFRPYLLAEAADCIAAGQKDILAFGAVTKEHQTCGAIAGELSGHILTVFSLYVDEQVRRRGVADLLLEELQKACPGACLQAAWLAPEAGARSLAAFWETKGFMLFLDEGEFYRFPVQCLRAVPLVRRAFSPGFQPYPDVAPLSSLTAEEQAVLASNPRVDRRLLPQALEERLSPELSFCFRCGGAPQAWLACGEAGNGDVTVLAAAALEGAPTMAIFHLMAAAAHAALGRFGENFSCWMETVTQDGRALACAIGGAEGQLWLEGRAEKR